MIVECIRHALPPERASVLDRGVLHFASVPTLRWSRR
jgi:hypothetical protein